MDRKPFPWGFATVCGAVFLWSVLAIVVVGTILTFPPRQSPGDAGTLLTAWLTCLCWFITTVRQLRGWEDRTTKQMSLLGLGSLILHAVIAMYCCHAWSLTTAYEFTEKQSGFGAGLYVNFAVILLWGIDWYFIGRSSPSRFRQRLIRAIRFVTAFIVFNASVVFVSNGPRYFAMVAFVWILFEWIRIKIWPTIR